VITFACKHAVTIAGRATKKADQPARKRQRRGARASMRIGERIRIKRRPLPINVGAVMEIRIAARNVMMAAGKVVSELMR